jgi:hypothetical protein
MSTSGPTEPIQEELEQNSVSDSDDTRSWHCGCPYDPYPDDMFQGCDPPDPNYESDADIKKGDGFKKHHCKQTTKTSKKNKAIKKSKKQKEKPKVYKDELENDTDED